MFWKSSTRLAAALLLVTSAGAQQATSTASRSDQAMPVSPEEAAYRKMPDTTGSGPYPATMEMDLAAPNDTLYHPADLSHLGNRKLGVLIWGNGGCSNDGASARLHLSEIASHGFLVVAPGKVLTGPSAVEGAPTPQFMQITVEDMRRGLDWALAENERKGSLFYRLLDRNAVAVSGHSCGGMLAVLLASDPRIHAVIIHNSGIFSTIPARPTLLMHEERLQGIHTPVLLILGGKDDIAWNQGTDAFEHINQVPVMLASLDVGHMGTFMQPNGGAVAQIAADWLEWQLHRDAKGRQNLSKQGLSLVCGYPMDCAAQGRVRRISGQRNAAKLCCWSSKGCHRPHAMLTLVDLDT